MENNDSSELLQSLSGETEPDSHVLSKLVRNHANLNDISTLNKALCITVEQGFLNTMRILLEAGASPNTRLESDHETLLHRCSADQDRTEIILELLKHGADINAVDERKKTPLHSASIYGRKENMKELLANGATVDAVDDAGDTPLLYSIQFLPTVSSVQVLLDAGANVNFVGKRGNTPLHYAVRSQNSQIVRLLLRYNADATVRDVYGDTPLHGIAFVCNETNEIIKELLKAGARLNELNNKGNSALLRAVNCYNEKATQALLRWGAAFDVVECFEALDALPLKSPKNSAIAKELIRYEFIKNPDSLESIHKQLMQGKVGHILRKLSSPECNLESFKHDILIEVNTLSKLSCHCGNASIWGCITYCEEYCCDTHQAILKFLFSGRDTNFSDAFFYKLSKEFLLEVTLNLLLYFELKESEKRLSLPWPCMKVIDRYVSFEDTISFLECKQSEMEPLEFEKFQVYMRGESSIKSSSEINPPGPKARRVS